MRGVLRSVLGMLSAGATHVAVATDQVIESFRNDLWPGYKTGQGIAPDLMAQFPLLEEVLSAAGIVVWPMVEFEADDALAAGAALAERDQRVEQVIICTPDKDLAQCVRGKRVVQLNRRARVTRDEAGIIAKFGVSPASIPDYLALVGDAADGYPGLPGWGAKSAAAVLRKFGHFEEIPDDWHRWHVDAAQAGALSQTLRQNYQQALLFRTLATLRTDIPLFRDVDELEWNGPTAAFARARKPARFSSLRTSCARKEKVSSGGEFGAVTVKMSTPTEGDLSIGTGTRRPRHHGRWSMGRAGPCGRAVTGRLNRAVIFRDLLCHEPPWAPGGTGLHRRCFFKARPQPRNCRPAPAPLMLPYEF